MNFEKETDIRKPILLGLWIMFAIILIVGAVILTVRNNISDDECLEMDSPRAHLMLSGDARLGKTIIETGHKFGPYFTNRYNFCKEVE